MSQSPKDSPEVMKFMTLFSRLKQWCDDAPEELEELARTDSSIRDVGVAVVSAASVLKFNERRHRTLFTAPVDPAFVTAWRDYEARYESVLAAVWFADFLLDLQGDGPAMPLKAEAPPAETQWEAADDEAREQASGIDDAIEFARFNADQNHRIFPDGSVERVQDGIAAWERLQRDTA